MKWEKVAMCPEMVEHDIQNASRASIRSLFVNLSLWPYGMIRFFRTLLLDPFFLGHIFSANRFDLASLTPQFEGPTAAAALCANPTSIRLTPFPLVLNCTPTFRWEYIRGASPKCAGWREGHIIIFSILSLYV